MDIGVMTSIYKINVMIIITKDENKKKNATSSYLLESCDV